MSMSRNSVEFGEEHLEDTREERPRADSDHRKIRTTDRISTEFIVLVEQLLALHVNEVESAKAEIEFLRKEVHQRDSKQDNEPLHFRQTLMSVDEDQEEPLHDCSRGSKRSSQGERRGDIPKNSQISVRSNTGKSKEILCKQHETLLPVDAEQIIDILDVNASDLDKVFQEKPIERDFVPGVLSETASVLGKRYNNLTTFEKMQYWVQSGQYEMSIFFVLYLNVLFMALELHISGLASWQELSEEYIFSQQDLDSWHTVFTIGDLFFASVFVLDVVVRLFVLRCSFWKTWLNYIDMVVSLFSLAEVAIYAVAFPVNPVIFRLLRVGKMVRAVRMVAVTSQMASLQLLVKCLASSRDMLLSSFSILTFVQCVAGVILSTLCIDFINDETQDKAIREEVWKYYGSFSRTFLTMFEVFFANWGPPCRVLVENVSEWFSIFFLIYRCVLGFAVLNVMNAVFVQQTMRTAVMDEDLAYKQRQKEIAQYIKKVKTLFQGLDSTGNGSINLEEFSKLVKSDKLAFWMSQLELEYHDLLQLFEFLDNGDGQITLTEFIDGAARLRGGAKAIDVWRMETKLEVLFEEVLEALSESRQRRRSTVQDVLRQSSFQFISSNSSSHLTPAQDAMSAAARNSLLIHEEDEELIQGIVQKRNSVFGLM